MTQDVAAKIAELINERNELDRPYDADRVLAKSSEYEYELDGADLVACVEVRRVQWYQWEVCHLSVNSSYGRKGHGTRMIQRAEQKAKDGAARLIQCTIRVGNIESEGAFRKQGYVAVNRFYNSRTNNYVAVWQKVLVCTP
jgi:GNAT superfamily N-acetyltransferase